MIIYLLAKAAPRVSNEMPPTKVSNPFDKMMAKLPMAKIDENINSFLAKFLRKSKIVIMKIDNFINHRLGKLSKKNGLSAGASAKEGNGNGDKKDGEQPLL